jgi:predicted methyltransferase
MNPLTQYVHFFDRSALALLMAIVTLLSGCASLSQDQIARIVASPDRSTSDKTNDLRRKPEQMLAFIGVKPGMVALDLSAGGGYTTELLARAVGPAGRVYGQSAPRPAPGALVRPPVSPEGGSASIVSAALSAPRPTSAQALAMRAQNPAVSNIVAVVQPFENPVPPELVLRGLDLVTLMFNYHDLGHMGVDRTHMNKAIFDSLKSGGIYVIADHSGRPGTGISESGTLHRIEEDFLIKEVEAVGLKLVAQGDFLRNPADPRDKNTPNPPMPKDEFVLKFIKP